MPPKSVTPPARPTPGPAPAARPLPTQPVPPLPPKPMAPAAPMPPKQPPIAAAPLPPKPPVSQAAPVQPRPPVGPLPRPVASATPVAPPAVSAVPSKPATPSGAAQPPQPPMPPAAPPAKPAEYKQSPLRFLPFVVGALLLVGLVFFAVTHLFGSKPATPVSTDNGGTPSTGAVSSGTSGGQGQLVTLTYWGLWEPSTVTQQVFADFEKTHPNIKVNYQQQSYQDYRERLETAISQGTGPDIFRFHASWTPMLRTDLAALPASVMSLSEYQNTFYPVAAQQLSVGNQIVGIPLMYDGLGLFYNEDALRTANAQPPTTWAELKILAQQLTIRSNGKIQRAGVALGNTSNVEHFSDILGLLLLQNGADLTNPTSQAAQDALQFYTNFVKTDKVWDSTLPSSTIAFARGDVAMMLAPSWRAHDIKSLNPNLKFKIAPVPQLAGNKIAWASYWAEGVNVQSKHQDEAWELLKYMSSPDTLQKLYSAASSQRAFGEIYPRKDLASTLANDPYVSSYLADAPNAQGWYLSSFTHDNGLNDFLIKYYEDAVNALLNGGDPQQTMNTVAQGTAQVLRQYNLSPTTR